MTHSRPFYRLSVAVQEHQLLIVQFVVGMMIVITTATTIITIKILIIIIIIKVEAHGATTLPPVANHTNPACASHPPNPPAVQVFLDATRDSVHDLEIGHTNGYNCPCDDDKRRKLEKERDEHNCSDAQNVQ